jgi:hypothetical protein
MSPREVSKILRAAADLLDAFPQGVDLADGLRRLAPAARKLGGDIANDRQVREHSASRLAVDEAFLQELSRLPAAELDRRFADERTFDRAVLLEIAQRAGIGTSPRQSRSALAHTISKHFERGRTDETIRSRTK